MAAKKGDNSVGEAGKLLAGYVERIERLQSEIDELKESQKEVFEQAKGKGLSVKVMKAVLRRRRMKPEDRKEIDELLDVYEHALETMLS